MGSNIEDNEEDFSGGIAIIGMSGRFPGAENIEEYWEMLCNGIEGIQVLSEKEDAIMRKNPKLRDHTDYVPAGGFINGVDEFDASFFGYTAREAQVMDPQQRIFLEEAWTVLEKAGYDSKQYENRIGVFAGAGMNQYFLKHVYPNEAAIISVGSFQTMLHNEKDYLSTRAAYKLGCKGASLTLQTACSTSLVAVAMASQSLLCYQNDMVIAGGVSLPAMEKSGYLYEQGGIASPDGHCRAFDEKALGTVPGNGVGVVLLKRLEDAQADGDHIYAVIKGSAMNNDGEQKMGFTAPSIEGQVEVIAEAIAQANVGAETIGFVEAHGTGTKLGDPIEVTALTKAYRMSTDKEGFCALGSVKTNIGHLDIASGVAGLIKATMVLQNKMIPPTLHFQKSNPEIDFEKSPFYVNSNLISWPEKQVPRRAGVSSFGLGGTNVHVVLEEAPSREESGASRPYQLIFLSAKTPTALDRISENLVNTLTGQADLPLADIAYTLHVGRRVFPYRRVMVAETNKELIHNLSQKKTTSPEDISSGQNSAVPLFLFPGQGAQYINMGKQLYETQHYYRKWIDVCTNLFQIQLGEDLRQLMYPAEGTNKILEEKLQQTQMAQAVIFTTEYAMAQLLISFGIHPQAMIGHSLGEFTAAVLAEVLTLEDAIYLVSQRGRLMQSMPFGEMISASVSETLALQYSNDRISVAAVNAPSLCVFSGTGEAISQLEVQLTTDGIEHRRLHTSHAFHSAMMKPAAETFENIVREVKLSPPKIPYVSGFTGTWITDEEATDPTYWARQLYETVYFAKGVETLIKDMNGVPIEVGPGRTLSVFVSQQPLLQKQAIHTIRHPLNQREDYKILLEALGELWLKGIDIDVRGLYEGQNRHRVVLPTYPFERKRYWLEEGCINYEVGTTTNNDIQSTSKDDFLYKPEQKVTTSNTISTSPADVLLGITALWSELLGEDRVEITQDFFELGGHSLLGIRLMKRMRELFQIELPESTLYEFPTIEGLAGAVQDATLKQRRLPKIHCVERSQHIPASWIQNRMWEREMIQGGECCTTAVGWEYKGNLDISLLERCINELIERHEVLRTSLHKDEKCEELLQVIQDSVDIDYHLPIINLTHLTEDEQEREMHALAFIDESTPFDLSRPLLWRLTLYLRSNHRYALFINAHNSIMDGPSANIFLRELGGLLHLRGQGSADTLPPLPVQFADYAKWEQEIWSGDRYTNYLSYWKEKLKDIRITKLPTDRPRKPEGAKSAVESFTLNPNVSELLRKTSHTYSCSLYTVLLTGFNIAMHTITGMEDLVTETSFSNRNVTDIEGIIGSLVNFVLLRVNFSQNSALSELILRTRETVNGAIAHSELPFVKIMEELYPELYRSERNYVRGVAFTQYEKGSSPPWPGLVTERRLWARRSLFDFYMSAVDEGEEGIVFNVEYDSYLFDSATIKRWLVQYNDILQQIVTAPNSHLNDFVAISSTY